MGYDPVTMHFTQADTIVPNATDSTSYDRYAYVLNNPVRYSDPSGHACREDGFCVFQPGERIPTSTKTNQIKVIKYTGIERVVLKISKEQYYREMLTSWAIYNQKNYAGKNNCVTFTSQAVNSIGLETNEIWYQGSTAWINVPANYGYFESLTANSEAITIYENGEWNYENLKKVKPGDIVYFWGDEGFYTTLYKNGSEIAPSHGAIISGSGNQTGINCKLGDCLSNRINTEIIAIVPLIVDVSSPASEYEEGQRSIDDIGSKNMKIVVISLSEIFENLPYP